MSVDAGTENIERIVEEYSDMLLRISYQYTSNLPDAQDAVQSVFLKFLRNKPEFKDSGHEKAWFIRVAINHCKDFKTSAWNKRTVGFEEYMANTPSGENNAEKCEMLELVRALPEKYRGVVFLYYYEGYSTMEIAKILDIKQNTVESRLFRARNKLREKLEEANEQI